MEEEKQIEEAEPTVQEEPTEYNMFDNFDEHISNWLDEDIGL